MNDFTSALAAARTFLPLLAVVAVVAAVLATAQVTLRRRYGDAREMRLRVQLVMAVLTLAGLLAVLLALPIGDALKGQLLGFLGILLSAAIALSSTTFLGNALAGILLRVVSDFRLGDFIAVDLHFGRVSERGLFHTEIQTADRDLTTLPNLYLVTNPVKVVRQSGTIVSATLSLGYDVPRAEIKRCLLTAAAATGLEEPFVHVLELGDFSITYRVAGLLTDVKLLLSKRSDLRAAVADELHAAGIEIVSPSFMTTRSLAAEHKVVPTAGRAAPTEAAAPDAEAVVFDKAEEAGELADLEAAIGDREQEIAALEKQLASAGDEDRRTLEARIEHARSALEAARRQCADRTEALDRSD